MLQSLKRRNSDLDIRPSFGDIPVDTGRKLNVHKTFRRRPRRLMNVQFTSCVYRDGAYETVFRSTLKNFDQIKILIKLSKIVSIQ